MKNNNDMDEKTQLLLSGNIQQQSNTEKVVNRRSKLVGSIKLALLVLVVGGFFLSSFTGSGPLERHGDVGLSDDGSWLDWLHKHFPWLFPDEPADHGKDRFHWKPCGGGISRDFSCGALSVPLDHLRITNDTRNISIAVIKYKARKEGRKGEKVGSILLNPGGPGGSGWDTVKNGGPMFSKITGGQYDIIGFDPRGIDRSKKVICFEDPISAMIFDNSVDSIPGKDPVSIARYAAKSQVASESCGKWSGDLTKFISTAYTARDMDLIREALGEEKLNYFGFSYGTFLGITYVNMFPDRVGRVVLDGVTDPTTFAGNYLDWSLTSLQDMEKVLDAFGAECEAAGSTRCALANLTTATTPKVSDLVRQTFKSLETNPIPVVDGVIPSIVTADMASQVVMQSMYSPKTWPGVAKALADIITSRDGNALLERGFDVSNSCPVDFIGSRYSFLAVKCADGKGDKENTVEMWEEGSLKTEKLSPLAGRGWTYMGLACKWWPGEPVERFDGPWNHTTANKVLLLGNTFDPVTPLASAKVAERLMGGNGVLVTHDGYGHCSIAQSSSCTLSVLYNYFIKGEVPEPGRICKADVGVFPGGDGFSGLSLEDAAMSLEMQKLQEVLANEQLK
ncbi:hypothetical protein HDU76_005227, partial [Blyttiomyces sp. JEL0837]